MAKDIPIPFGFKMSWLAIKNTNQNEILDLLNLKQVVSTDWETGLSTVYYNEKAIFVSPLIKNEWYLVVGYPLITDFSDRKKLHQLLETLSIKFEAQMFATHRVSDAHQWIGAAAGKVVREYEYGDGEVIADFGDKTPVEIKILQPEKDGLHPLINEGDVMKVAKEWSLDPTTLSNKTPVHGDCFLGVANFR